MHLTKQCSNIPSKGLDKEGSNLQQNILRNVERAGSLALHVEQETCPFMSFIHY
jgi:hypothetical protein